MTEDAPRRCRRPWLRLALLALLVLLAGSTVAVGLAALDLLAARGDLETAVVTLRQGNLASATVTLDRAADDFSSADRRLRAPWARPAAHVPLLGRNVRVLQAVAASGAQATRAGRDLVGAVTRLGGLAALAPRRGAVPIAPLRRLAAPLSAAAAELTAAEGVVALSPSDGLVGPLADARAALVQRLSDTAGTARVSAALARVLPDFLGADGPRRYFFAAQNPAELRGTGGFLGAYAILTVEHGRLRFGRFKATSDLPRLPAGRVPPPNPDFAARYDRFASSGDFRNSNFTPDFPSAASAIERLWEQTATERLDGTVVADPFALQALLRVTGAQRVPAFGRVGANRVVAIVTNEAYARLTESDARKALLGQVAASTLQGFLRRGGDPSAGLTALAALTGDGHLLLHAADPPTQDAFETAGVSGRLLNPPGDYLSVVVNNLAMNKVDYYVRRTVDYRVALGRQGQANAGLRLWLTNDAPVEGPPKYIIGPNVEGLEAGDSRYLLSVFARGGTTLEASRRRQGDARVTTGTELGHAVFATTDILPGGGVREVIGMDWVVPTAWTVHSDGRATYRLTVQDQRTIHQTRYRVDIAPPSGWRAVDAGEATLADNGHVVWSGPSGPAGHLVVRFEPDKLSAWDRLRRLFASPFGELRAGRSVPRAAQGALRAPVASTARSRVAAGCLPWGAGCMPRVSAMEPSEAIISARSGARL